MRVVISCAAVRGIYADMGLDDPREHMRISGRHRV